MYIHWRNLPHLYIEGGTYFITFRLFDSLPNILLNAWLEELRVADLNKTTPKDLSNNYKRFFQKFDNYLDACNTGNDYLKHENIAQIVKNKLHSFDNIRYELLAYCIMPNHVHVLIKHYDSSLLPVTKRVDKESPLSETMRLIKGASARHCNELLGRKGTFWQSESYDHLVRDRSEQDKILQYIVNNPVKAGLVKNIEDYSHTFVTPFY